MISSDTIQQIKDSAHIEEVVSRFLTLRRRGNNYVACCPFHNEKTGSFNVNPARNIFKCFGCGKSGDSISFLMEHAKMTYPEALRFLADMYGVVIEETELTDEERERQHQRDSLLKLTAYAQQQFAEHLDKLDFYLCDRALTLDVAKTFRLGCKTTDTFAQEALAAGYSKDTLLTTGLAYLNEEGILCDTLPRGLIFPILSGDGKVISFVCKHIPQLDADSGVSSTPRAWTFLPCSPIYNNANALFGLYQAKNTKGKLEKYYLVSHFEVVLTLHASGITNCIAPCSSGVTIEQIKSLKRLSHDVTLVCGPAVADSFDARNLLQMGMHLRIVVFPQGQTPDSYASAHGSSALQEFLNQNEMPFVFYRADRLIAQLGTQGAMTPIVELLSLFQDKIERDAYIPGLAERLCVSEESLNHLSQTVKGHL